MTILDSIRIANVIVTPVAFHDPPLLNAVGVHEPFALRSIIEVETDAGITGLGESYGDADTSSDFAGWARPFGARRLRHAPDSRA